MNFKFSISSSTSLNTLIPTGQVLRLDESREMHHCWASLVNKLPNLADQLERGGSIQLVGEPGQSVDLVGGPGQQSVQLVGGVAHGLALRGTEAFLPWMEKVLHFLNSEETG